MTWTAIAIASMLVSVCANLPAQDALAELPNLVPNGGFEQGTDGWRVTIGPYGQAEDRWQAAKGVAEVLDRDAFAGQRCLRLNAREQDGEVDVATGPFPVQAGEAYLLNARVRQLAGERGYKVVIDWQDAAGKHLSYDNDWRGNDHPGAYAAHGGVFIAPEDASQAVVLLGVAPGVECTFDDVRLSPVPGGAGEDVPDGVGEFEALLPTTVEAGGYATFRFTYRAGEQGLPVGASVYLRRDNTDPRWSVPQSTDPKAPGYTTVEASNGALLAFQPGGEATVPCVSRVTVQYPAPDAGDTITITYGDTAQGSLGAQVQPKVEEDIHFVLSVDGDRDDRPLDLPESRPFAVTSGPFSTLGLVVPAVAEAGTPFFISLEARDRFGNLVSTHEGAVTLASQGEDSRLGGTVSFARRDRGRHPVRITLKRPGTRVLSAEAQGVTAEQVIVVSNPPARPDRGPDAGAQAVESEGTFMLQNPHVRLLLPPNDFGYGVAILEARDGATWKRAGTFTALGQLWTGKAGDETENAPIWLPSVTPVNERGRAGLTLAGEIEAGGTAWDAQVECALEPDARHVSITCAATPRAAVPLRAFYGASLFAGDGSFGAGKHSALLPGLEYLAGEEVSSGDYGIVPPHSLRVVPHPYKITMPMMAVCGDGICVALLWDPTQEWTAGKPYPSACFASPERWDDRASHFLGLCGPSVLDGLPENARQLEEPLLVEAGQTLTLTTQAVALAPSADVSEAVRYWFEVNGVLDAPPLPRNREKSAELTARGFLETAWDGEEKGWHNALPDPWGAAYNDQIALRLWHYAQSKPASSLAPRIEAQLTQAFGAAGGRLGYDFAFHSGNAADVVRSERAVGQRDALAMAGDGSYAFHPHTGNKMFTQAQSKSIGRDGEVNVGTCVMGLEPLMRRALITGDPFLVAQGEKGLACLDQFGRPQGAENWEVPLACPNLRAAALACRCYLYGYLLTGKAHYLERARFWATTGLPLIYMWNAADRPVMRYASISVMGTTLHTHTWFARPVQWVGLVYADALVELAAHDDSFPWAKVAQGILTCATQMQKTEADECGHVGFYLDAYSTIDGHEAYHWCLAPTLIVGLQDALQGMDPKVGATIVRTGDGTVHILAPGETTDGAFDGGTLTFTSRFLAGSTHEIIISPMADAGEVLVDGEGLAQSDLAAPGDLGWQLVPPNLLRLRIRHEAEATSIEVRGCRLAEASVAVEVDEVANGSFEQGLSDWLPDTSERARLVEDAHSGDAALELDATGRNTEVQCTSRLLTVTGGKTYELASWVKQTAGEGKYKVTIDWLGVGGHLAYANDWLGTNQPADYSQHGGRFTAPPDARAAVVILGVQPGVRCVFDDVQLR